MATGSEICSVFHAVELIALRPPFSQYSRPDEVALFVSQYSVTLSSTSSLVGDCSGSSPYVHCAKPGWTRSHAARPAGESAWPYPTACGRAVIIAKYAAPPVLRYMASASNVARSCSELPAGAGPPAASAASTSEGTVAGKLTWMPSRPAGAWRAITLEIGEPQSPPWAT